VFRLKSALMALGLKCGGTLQERAERYLMSVLKKKIMFIRILACLTTSERSEIFPSDAKCFLSVTEYE
jgi:hypothetical protein